MASTWTYWPPDNARYAGDIWSTAVHRGVCDSDQTEWASNCLVCRAGDTADPTVCWYQPDWRRQFVRNDLFYTLLHHLTAPGNYNPYRDIYLIAPAVANLNDDLFKPWDSDLYYAPRFIICATLLPSSWPSLTWFSILVILINCFQVNVIYFLQV